MVETLARLPYTRAMKRSSLATILRASANDLLDSLDLRSRPRTITMQRGESVAAAWQATGMYLRRAMDEYAQSAGPTRPRRK